VGRSVGLMESDVQACLERLRAKRSQV